MERLTFTVWGCGRIGHQVAKHLHAAGHKILWCKDRDPARAGFLAQEIQGSFLPEIPMAEHHPQCDVIVDATGDASLLPYWRKVLGARRARYVILTRREPEADMQVMAGLPGGLPSVPESSITAMGSCTGNAWVPFITHLSDRFDIESASCRVLHPLKQNEIHDLRVIPTALWHSLNDHRPSLASRFEASSMEIPVDRGMALDFAVAFSGKHSKEEILEFLKALTEEHHTMFGMAEEEPTSATITGDSRSWVLGPNWTVTGRLMRGLLWQDNEGGYAARILEVVKALDL